MCKLILASLLALAGTAQAADNGFYMGAGVSQVRIDDALGSAFSQDLEDTSWKIVAGFRLLDHLAVEANYMDLGSERMTSGMTSGSVEAKALAAHALGIVPLPFVDLYAKVGLARWETEGAVPGVGIPEDPPSIRVDDSGTEFAYGAGVQARLGSLAARLEYERFDIDGTEGLDLFTLALTWTFL